MQLDLGFKDNNGQTAQSKTVNPITPLAFKARPKHLDRYFGQDHIIQRLKKLNFSNLPHMILWGPPGSGKTTLCHILAEMSGLELFSFNAVLGGLADLKKLIKSSMELLEFQSKKSIIFIDEIHRFNKAQQDCLLPHLEQGHFILFGATTEYPKTSLNPAILSRVHIFGLQSLTSEDILQILKQASLDNDIADEYLDLIADTSNGDARIALNALEYLINLNSNQQMPKLDEFKKHYLEQARHYDKNGNRHHDVTSAFIKSIRGSDVDASLLWLAVMLDGGEDIEFIARRLIILASEDIGLADPQALILASQCHYSIKQIGMPEARILLSQTTIYLAKAAKSNSSYMAINRAMEYVKHSKSIDVPTHLRSSHFDKKKYLYPHDFKGHWVEQEYSPIHSKFYHPSEHDRIKPPPA